MLPAFLRICLDAGGPSVPAAIVESSYSGAGTPGHVFLEEINLASDLGQMSINL
jgi:hypothetical protein